MKIGLVKTCDILPVTHPEINYCSLHISYKWKGQNPRKRICPYWKNDIFL